MYPCGRECQREAVTERRNTIEIVSCIYLNIWTPYFLTIQVIAFEQVHFTTFSYVLNLTVINHADPEQTPHSVTSDLGVCCLLRHVCLNTWIRKSK